MNVYRAIKYNIRGINVIYVFGMLCDNFFAIFISILDSFFIHFYIILLLEYRSWPLYDGYCNCHCDGVYKK